MNNNPKISVVMPVYNGERFLREQLDSIYTQTISPFEVIAVDDCSTDNSSVILKEYTQKYGLIYVQNEQNLGVNKNFEKAIMLSSGDYIAPSDQDDIWAENKLEECYKAILDLPKNEPNIIVCQSVYMDNNGKPYFKNINFIKEKQDNFYQFFPFLEEYGACSLFNSILKNIAIPFKTSLNYDQELVRLATFIGNRVHIPTTWRLFRRHSYSLTRKPMNQTILAKLIYCLKIYFIRYLLNEKRMCEYMEFIEKLELNIEHDKMEFINKLKGNLQKRYRIFLIKEFSFSKRILVFIIFYVWYFYQSLKKMV